MSKTLFALIVTSSSIAAAGPRVATLSEPAVEETAPTTLAMPAPTEPDAYVAIGATFGAGNGIDWLYGATSIEAGYRLTEGWYVRGRVDRTAGIGYGPINRSITFTAPEHAHTDTMLGLETRRCWTAQACFTAGADAGYHFADDTYRGGFEIAPRVGLDFGSRHVRVRPGIEANLDFLHRTMPDSGEPAAILSPGIGFTTALVYQW